MNLIGKSASSNSKAIQMKSPDDGGTHHEQHGVEKAAEKIPKTLKYHAEQGVVRHGSAGAGVLCAF